MSNKIDNIIYLLRVVMCLRIGWNGVALLNMKHPNQLGLNSGWWLYDQSSLRHVKGTSGYDSTDDKIYFMITVVSCVSDGCSGAPSVVCASHCWSGIRSGLSYAYCENGRCR